MQRKKKCARERKMCKGKKCTRQQRFKMKFKKSQLQWGQNFIFCGTMRWYWIAVFALYGLMWSRMAFFGNVWPYVALCGLICSCCCFSLQWPCVSQSEFASMALCVIVRSCMAFFGLIWHLMVFYGRISSFLAVIPIHLVLFIMTQSNLLNDLKKGLNQPQISLTK